MPHIAPVDLTASDKAKADIEWLASATGFVANSMLTLSHRPEIAKAVLGLIRAVVRSPGTVDPALLARRGTSRRERPETYAGQWRGVLGAGRQKGE